MQCAHNIIICLKERVNNKKYPCIVFLESILILALLGVGPHTNYVYFQGTENTDV